MWRFLREQGFTEQAIRRLQRHIKGTQYSEQKVQENLALNVAALRQEGLDTGTIEQLYQQQGGVLLHTTQATFSSSLAVLRQLAELLPNDNRRLLAPVTATRLGAALYLYPTSSAKLLSGRSSRITSTEKLLHELLGIGPAEVASALFKYVRLLIAKPDRARRAVQFWLNRGFSTEAGEQVGGRGACRWSLGGV